MSTNQQNVFNALDSILNPENILSTGMSLTNNQSEGVPSGLITEIIQIPSVSQCQFGSLFVIDIKETNILLNNITLAFTTLAGVSGITATTVGLAPFVYAFSRIELVVNNIVIDSIYGNQQHIIQNQLNYDFDRSHINQSWGAYDQVTKRNTLASGANTYFVNLQCFVDQIKFPILNSSHTLQLRIYMNPLSEILTTTGTVTGTAACSLTAVAICKVTRLPPLLAQAKLSSLMSRPVSRFFHSTSYGLYTLQGGSTNYQIVLSAIVGKVCQLTFVVRKSAELTGENSFKYLKIKDFSILNSSSINITGGVAVSSELALKHLNLYWNRSSITTETDAGATDNKQYIYNWSFSSDNLTAIESGRLLGSKTFQGNESLIINFASALSGSHQVEVYCLMENVLTIGGNYVSKASA